MERIVQFIKSENMLKFRAFHAGRFRLWRAVFFLGGNSVPSGRMDALLRRVRISQNPGKE
jgi:hypothetical protein